jgi:hypothetical protein
MKRFKYYIAWTLGDAVNNASGLGFNGYDEKAQAKWNLVTNINIWHFEVYLDKFKSANSLEYILKFCLISRRVPVVKS